MKTNKRGISLIVLVITIIVIIILAAAVILTLNGNNPIENSKQATFDSDCAELKSAMSMYMTTFMANDANHDGPFTVADKTTEPPQADIVVSIGTGTDATPSEEVGKTRTATNTVTWAALGFSDRPASIKTAKYNTTTGLFTIEPTNTGLETKTNW